MLSKNTSLCVYERWRWTEKCLLLARRGEATEVGDDDDDDVSVKSPPSCDLTVSGFLGKLHGIPHLELYVHPFLASVFRERGRL